MRWFVYSLHVGNTRCLWLDLMTGQYISLLSHFHPHVNSLLDVANIFIGHSNYADFLLQSSNKLSLFKESLSCLNFTLTYSYHWHLTMYKLNSIWGQYLVRKLTIENCLFISAKLHKLFIRHTATKTKCKNTILASEIQNCMTFPSSIELNGLEPEFFCFLLYYVKDIQLSSSFYKAPSPPLC